MTSANEKDLPGRKTPVKNRKRRKKRRFSAERRRRRRIIRLSICAVAGLILLILIIFLISRLVTSLSGTSKADGSGKASTDTVELIPESAETEATQGEATQAEAAQALEEEASELEKNKPDIDINSWEYILANSTRSIESYHPEVEEFEGVYLDQRIIDAMDRFVSDTRAQGLDVVMTSGYRSYETQSELFQNKVDEYGDEETAATIVARPGTSEHQTGLAADICDDYYEYMNESLEQTETYQWMSSHCQEYGFIVRFPKNKEDITGIIYEPWHYRYVGKEAAAFINENDLTLEEFVELYKE